MTAGEGGGIGQLPHIDPNGSFLKNLVLSVLLLGLSSFLIPLVLKQIDDRKAVDQQQLQAQLTRQDSVINEQAELLDVMTSDFWEYEFYASDLVISRDDRFGQDAWHQRAVDDYYRKSGPLLGRMRADISELLLLAPRANYDAFLRLYEEEIIPLDSCLLELMNIEADAMATPIAVATPSGEAQPIRCVETVGKFAGASWDDLAAAIVSQDLTGKLDDEFASLARAFQLAGAPE